MLSKIVEIVNNSQLKSIQNSTLFCQHTINDLSFLNTLYDSEFIENSDIDDCGVGNSISLEFSLPKLSTLGFFETKKSFLQKNYYKIPTEEIYIYESNDYLSNDLSFNKSYEIIVKLANEISSISKFTYKDTEIANSFIVREDKSLFIPLKYSLDDLKTLKDSTINIIEKFIGLLKTDAFEDKKNVYLNFLIEFLSAQEEMDRFSFLINSFADYNEKAQATYSFYLRNFSYNKLKVELDSKALEFNQKLQFVINDSQTKLIAIPTALVLVLSTIDYEHINSTKNYLSVVGLIIFCIFIQLFVSNQRSMLNFIEENIIQYKLTFKGNKIIELEKSFEKVEKEKRKQSNRLLVIQLLLWLVPILTTSVLLFLSNYKIASTILCFMYLIFSTVVIILNMGNRDTCSLNKK